MWAFLNALRSSDKKSTRRGKRREARFETDLLATELGRVVNVSGSGLRVRCEGQVPVGVGQELPLTVGSAEERVNVRCRVIRIKRAGLRGPTDVSVVFVDADPMLRARIQHLGRFGFIPPTGRAVGSDADARQRPRKGRKSPPDYYAALGIEPAASAGDIRRAYHRLAHERHPDASRDQASSDAFAVIAEAYRVLRDPDKRRAYDALRTESATAA